MWSRYSSITQHSARATSAARMKQCGLPSEPCKHVVLTSLAQPLLFRRLSLLHSVRSRGLLDACCLHAPVAHFLDTSYSDACSKETQRQQRHSSKGAQLASTMPMALMHDVPFSTVGDPIHHGPNQAGNKSLLSFRADIGVPGYTGFISAPHQVRSQALLYQSRLEQG
jgi:hypothetical protein